MSEQDPDMPFFGTAEYFAPEVLHQKPLGEALDWWGLGVFTYELLFGKTPFHNENKRRMFKKICTRNPVFPPNADPVAKDFIKALLRKKPEHRLDYHEIKQHPFFKGIKFRDVIQKRIPPLYSPGEFGVKRSLENANDEVADSECVGIDDDFPEFTFMLGSAEFDELAKDVESSDSESVTLGNVVSWGLQVKPESIK
jgi:serine/threonine protein kinase